jgi:PAS domain S-box-containing protein
MHSSPKRILIVEDNQSLVHQISQAFEADSKEFQLEIVTSVHDAIKAIFHHVPDLVLTEQTLADGTFHDIIAMSCDVWPIIVMIPFGKEHGAEDAMNAGALDYIVKSSGSVWNLPHVIGHSLREWQIIRERKQLTMLLRGSEDRYLILFEHSTDGILHIDLAGNILKMNRSFAKMHGYDVRKMQGFNLQDFSPNFSVKSIVSRLKEIPESREVTMEIENRHRDGQQVPLNVSICLISGENQPYLVAFHRDTRECKSDSLVVKRNKSWEQIFDHVSDMIYIVEDDYTVTYCNHSMANQFGLSSSEITGMRCYEVVHGLNAPPAFCPKLHRSKGKLNLVNEIEKHELGARFNKMSIMPLTQFNKRNKSMVHVVQIEPANLQKHLDLIPVASFA